MRTRRLFRHGLLPQLLVFEAVARLGSVTRAAEELHLAQPTVSLQLKKLAEALEVQLFEQRGRQLHLTGAGYALREACDELVHCLLRADARLEAWRRPKQHVLRLAAEPESRAVAAQLLAEFCSRHPGVQGSLHVDERAELLARL
ncbi:MAG TPA: LysR family transcriptional regulator, partial [Burkholderiales bacterium]|nr:LysR family transcriptional regulator [Burkholderiales bacterium]